MKLKQKTKQRIRGSVTVLLVMILLPMMTFSALVVDMSRLNMAKQMMSSAGDLAMNTALANYDTILKDVYGLFAMSQGGKKETADEYKARVAADLQDYFEKTLVSYGAIEEDYAEDYVSALMGDFNELLSGNYNVETTDFLELQDITVTAAAGVESSSLANADILRKQIVEYMKYRAPLNFGMGFLDSLKAFQTVDDQNDVVEAQVKAQESTQDVTQACSKLIKLIREYDDLVVKLDSGASAVKGKDRSDDGVIIPLVDYDAQVDKYRGTWADNYAHINKLMLVFQGNTPSIDNCYLKNLDYGSSVYFIKSGGAGLRYSGSGIDVPVSKAADAEQAKRQVDDQIARLDKSYKKTANNYVAKDFLSSSLLGYNYTSFSDEAAAVSTFVDYEKFLTNQLSDVKYSQVKEMLDEIYKLGKYYDNFKSKIDAEVAAAENAVSTAEGKVTAQTDNKNKAANAMKSSVSTINSTASAYTKRTDAFDCLGLQLLLKAEAKATLAKLPTVSGGYSSYYNTNLKEGSGNKYLETYKSIVNDFFFKDTEICKAAKNYLTKTEGKSFTNYMKAKVNKKVVDEDLFKLLNCLYTCSEKAESFSNNITNYNKADQKLREANSEVTAAERELSAKQSTRSSTQAAYNTCLNGFYNFGAAYQADLYYYSRFITTAGNIAAAKAARIKTQFTSIKNNVKLLRDKLDAISDQITVVKTAITTYNTNVDNWESKNNTYMSENSSDSFSKQNASDIKAARSEYDINGYDTLDKFVINLWDEYDELYTRLTDTTHYKYGTKKIDAVNGVSDLNSAISGIKGSLPSVVTVEEAANRFGNLYKADTTPMYEPRTIPESNQLRFLEPVVLQVKVLQYLNGAYPEAPAAGSTQEKENKAAETEYNTQKDKLVSGSGGSVEDSEESGGSGAGAAGDKYGYTYKNRGDLPQSGLPSSKSEKKKVENTEFKLSEKDSGDGNKSLDASSGVSQQASTMDKILSGIGDAVNAGLENAYVLSYVFENFSYSTMVQDAIVEANDIKTYPAAIAAVSDATKIADAKASLETLSGYKKNAANNYLNGGEAEYIMYGSLTPKTNITYAKASIYGIRFGFNCIYAFTNSTIRNTTMAAGLAVQAATLGIVPYQVVQIVLQLALAAAESAIDLDMMDCGLKVAIVKTTDTWTLGPSGLANTAKSVMDEALDTATRAVSDAVITNVSDGLQSLVNAGAAELDGAIQGVGAQLETATKKVVTDFVDRAFSEVMGQIEEGLNSLQYGEETKAAVQARSNQMFQSIRSGLHTTLNNLCGGNELILKVLPDVEDYANELIGDVQEKVDAALQSATTDNVLQVIAEQLTPIKNSMITSASALVQDAIGTVTSVAQETVAGVQDQINSYIGEKGAELSEEAAAQVKEQVSGAVNDYIGTYVDVGNDSAIGGGSTSSNVASMIKFGYKDYLMLFTYISICVNDDPVLCRTADMIQYNLQNAAGTGEDEFKHKKGSAFKMKNAMTYVTMEAEAQLDMFFLDLDFFANFLQGESEENADNKEAASKITYKGLLGY